ncbi:galactose ABC transporter substrate-binding protein [Clostridium sp.]|uniref:galactose ABC transporter substrate-binding protein n=1 Tax=Clostridium sp. TaxID=1506 RepID=UPI00260BCEC0|nr:galactose ABC transporter substrate-binding protein [Clostridium sp.]
MKRLILISFYIIMTLFTIKPINSYSLETNKIIKFAVLFYQQDNAYNNALKSELMKIQENNKDKVEFTFYDGILNQEIQNKQLEDVLKNKTDIVLVNIVDINTSSYIVNKVKESNIPIIFFNRELTSFDAIKSYGKSLYIGTDNCNLGISQGKMIVNQYKNKSIIENNNNNSLDYILLNGNKNSIESIDRSLCVIEEINNNGIKTNNLYSGYFNWDKETTKELISPLLLQFGNDLDIIISNNDDMAIGAIEALQKYGYNLGHSGMYIPVFGIDALNEAKDLIAKGFMEGTIEQSPKTMAEALYLVGLNLVEKKNPLQGTNYTFDSTGVAIRIPYGEAIIKKLKP